MVVNVGLAGLNENLNIAHSACSMFMHIHALYCRFVTRINKHNLSDISLSGPENGLELMVWLDVYSSSYKQQHIGKYMFGRLLVEFQRCHRQEGSLRGTLREIGTLSQACFVIIVKRSLS